MAANHNQETLKTLEAERDKSKKKLKYYEDRAKILESQIPKLTRKERTNRLCIRAGMLETFLQRPSDISNDQVMELLKLAFKQEPVKAALNQMLEEIRRKEESDEDESS